MTHLKRKVSQQISFSLTYCLAHRHIDTYRARANMRTQMNSPRWYLWFCLMWCEVMLLGKDGLEREGWGCLGCERARERKTLEKECPAAVWLTCVVVFGARKPRRSPNEFIIRLFQLRHSQWTDNMKQAETSCSSSSSSGWSQSSLNNPSLLSNFYSNPTYFLNLKDPKTERQLHLGPAETRSVYQPWSGPDLQREMSELEW